MRKSRNPQWESKSVIISRQNYFNKHYAMMKNIPKEMQIDKTFEKENLL